MNVMVTAPPSDTWRIIDRIKAFENDAFRIMKYPLFKSEFETYLKRALYPESYIKGFGKFFYEKALEHFASLKILTLNRHSIVMDVASSSSPFPDIIRDLYGCVSYREDLAYPKGIHGYQVGGDASSLPFSDNTFTHLTLHCSFEHFEKDADKDFIYEAARVLTPGGVLCIVPLYLSESHFIVTDPVHLEYCKGVVDKGADILIMEGWGNQFGRHYSPEVFRDRILTQCGKFNVILYTLEDVDSCIPPSYEGYVRFMAVFVKQ